MGSQILIEAPHGLILIDPNAGESFEQNWARMVGSGFDPMQIKYVLITHEHGDHAPGARLWRVVTGARSVAGATTAYDLQHLTPAGTGYGFHPPTPVDIPIAEDKELDLAGLKVKAICLPGHTNGSMGYVFQKNGKTYVSTGDLIMGGGVLGYDGSLDFSAEDVLRSLRKVASFRPDTILGGHGIGPADEFIAKGIEAGEETGWSRMTPPAPNPFYRFSQRNYLIAAWLEPIVAAAYGDIDGDGRPDVAVLVPKGKGSVVKIYLNHGGKFAERRTRKSRYPIWSEETGCGSCMSARQSRPICLWPAKTTPCCCSRSRNGSNTSPRRCKSLARATPSPAIFPATDARAS